MSLCIERDYRDCTGQDVSVLRDYRDCTGQGVSVTGQDLCVEIIMSL